MGHSIEGKVIVITGAGSGIGRATALVFAREKAKVVISDIDPVSGEKTSSLVREVGGQSVFVQADVSRAAEVERLINEAVRAYGRIDFAHNNAGIFPRGSTTECSEESWDKTIDINLKGVWLCMKYEIPIMIKQGGGVIVNTSSIAGVTAGRGRVAYTASKHGVIGLTKAAAMEYARSNIRVNAICPGVIHTPMASDFVSDPAVTKEVLLQYPLGRFGTTEEVAETVLWLCSGAATYITGQAICIDGGRTI